MMAGGELPFEEMKLAQLKEELAARGSTRSGLNPEGGAPAALARAAGGGGNRRAPKERARACGLLRRAEQLPRAVGL